MQPLDLTVFVGRGFGERACSCEDRGGLNQAVVSQTTKIAYNTFKTLPISSRNTGNEGVTLPTVLVTLPPSVCRLCMAQQSNQTLRAKKKKKLKKNAEQLCRPRTCFPHLNSEISHLCTSANLDVNENISLKNIAITYTLVIHLHLRPYFCPIPFHLSKAVYVEYIIVNIYCSCQGQSLMINVNCFVCISQDICDDHPPFSSGSCKTDSVQPPHSQK